jgi:methylase of polypeptide subunit release factors
LINESYSHLKKGGILVFEHSDDFVIDEATIDGRYEKLFFGKDYSNKNRFIALRRI